MTPVQLRSWRIWGMPLDHVSVENGLMMTRAKRWPLVIDPQGQANAWIKAMESRHGLKVIKPSDTNGMRVLEQSIRIGTPVLIEDVGETTGPIMDTIA